MSCEQHTKRAAQMRAWLKTEKGREYDRRRRQSATGKARAKRHTERWNASERAKEYKRQHRKQHIDRYRAFAAARQREYRARNPKLNLQRVRDYQRRHPEKVRAWREARNERTKERRVNDAAFRAIEREYQRRYRQSLKGKKTKKLEAVRRGKRSRSAAGKSTRAQLQARWDYFGGKCWMCGKPATTFDHVRALANGGSNWSANLRPACVRCNSQKRTKDVR